VSKRVALGFVLWVVAVLFTILYLGEHWVTDALAGWIYGLVIFAGVHWYATRNARQVG
jgi:membrane-associated phospholipid phosphatase